MSPKLLVIPGSNQILLPAPQILWLLSFLTVWLSHTQRLELKMVDISIGILQRGIPQRGIPQNCQDNCDTQISSTKSGIPYFQAGPYLTNHIETLVQSAKKWIVWILEPGSIHPNSSGLCAGVAHAGSLAGVQAPGFCLWQVLFQVVLCMVHQKSSNFYPLPVGLSQTLIRSSASFSPHVVPWYISQCGQRQKHAYKLIEPNDPQSYSSKYPQPSIQPQWNWTCKPNPI